MKKLTKREDQILNLVFDDYSTKEISVKTGLSVNTISTYRKRIIKKLKVKSLYGAYKKYLTNNFVN